MLLVLSERPTVQEVQFGRVHRVEQIIIISACE